MTRLFISHSSKDNAQARALCQWLDEQGWGPQDRFIDFDRDAGLQAGVLWEEELRRAGGRCVAMFLLLSPNWFASMHCRREFWLAHEMGKRILPILIAAVDEDRKQEDRLDAYQITSLIPQGPARRFTVEGATPQDVQVVEFSADGLERIRLGLLDAGIDATAFPWAPADPDKPNPYKGLDSLTEKDAAVFFGRGLEIVELSDLIRRLAIDTGGAVVIDGDSGVGKSSFVCAGVLPRLRHDVLHYDVLEVIRPSAGALRGAAAGQVDALAQARQGAPPAATAKVPRGGVVVVTVDQAEELLDPGNSGTAVRLQGMLRPLLQNPVSADGTRVVVLLLVRSDRREALMKLDMFDGVRPATYTLRAMAESELGAVVRGPAEVATANGYRLELKPDLVRQLLDDAKGAADALPLLSYTLSLLCERFARGHDSTLSVEQYRQMGGVQQAITWAVEDALEKSRWAALLPTEDAARKALLSRLFALIATMDVDSDTASRLLTPRSTFAADPQLDALAACLIDKRLLRQIVVAGDSRGPIVEVAHEAILRQWPSFLEWLSQHKEQLRDAQRLRRHAADWARQPADRSGLVERGARLQAARALLADPVFMARFGKTEQDYLARCEAEARSEALRRRGIRALSAALAVAALGLLADQWERAWVRQNGLHPTAQWSRPLWLLGVGVVPQTVAVKAQPFDMGCKPGRDDMIGDQVDPCPSAEDGEPGRSVLRRVDLSRSCDMGRTEVTFFQYDYFVWKQRPADPTLKFPAGASMPRGRRPVVDVSYQDALAYAAWLSKETKQTWRLPTEAEWEFAARDTPDTGPYPWGRARPGPTQVNCRDCTATGVARDDAAVVAEAASFGPNARGLYDMAGNVSEWVSVDAGNPQPPGPGRAIARGGSWTQSHFEQRVIERSLLRADTRQFDLGFRVCRDAGGSP